MFPAFESWKFALVLASLLVGTVGADLPTQHTAELAPLGVCGDGTLDAGEICDDGNALNGDGCETDCTQTVELSRQPPPGSIYKEFVVIIKGDDKIWRVTNPDGPLGGPYLPNRMIPLTVDDLDGAIRAEALIDVWGGHVGTSEKRFRFNENDWIGIADLTVTPTAGPCYMQQLNSVVDVPLGDLVEGINILEGTSGPQICHDFGWGQWGWYSLVLRVYYDTDKPHPTVSIQSPIDGDTLPEQPTITASVQSTVGVERVDFLAYYDGYDTDGDGVYQEYHRSYHRAKFDNDPGLSHLAGSATNPPWEIVWDTDTVPDQVAGSVKLIARVRDANGVWHVSDEATDLTLLRTDNSVRLYKASNVPEKFWVRGGSMKNSKVVIPLEDDLSLATSVKLLVRTWNGQSVGIDGFTRVNTWSTTATYGANHFYSYDVLNIPISSIQNGVNTISFFVDTVHHGTEFLWPGPALLVSYSELLPQCGDGLPTATEECDDGADNSDVLPDACRSDCTLPRCGDGTTDTDEQCDDGNNEIGDGCTENCVLEFCGDGIAQAGIGEGCDDGNTVAGDGCAEDCTQEACSDGLVCNDGLFCTGGDTCQGTSCVSSGDHCAADDNCDEVRDRCISPQLETVRVEVGSEFVAVALARTYVDPVVVCSTQYSSNSLPVVVRVQGVTSTAFQVRLQNPSGDPVVPDWVSCLVVEAGTWNIGGVKFEAQKYTSTVTDYRLIWAGESQSYGQSYVQPVVLGQVMTQNDAAWSVFWSRGASRSAPPSSSALWTGKHVGQDPSTERIDETVEFVVFESGHGTIGDVSYEAGLGPDTVYGAGGAQPTTYFFDEAFGSAPLFAVMSVSAMDGVEGASAQSHGPTLATPTQLFLSVDEDQTADDERNHTTEQVSYLAFETMLSHPAAAPCGVNADCDDGVFCNGEETCVEGTCQDGTPEACSDGVGCTTDSCNPVTDACVNAANDASCDNGAHCDGVETCDQENDCQFGTPVDCDDSVPCTLDLCNEGTDTCDNAPDDSVCQTGSDFCDPLETCNPALGCETGGDPCPGLFCDEALDQCVECQTSADCDDGLFCNGAESCDLGICQAGALACPGQICDESNDLCLDGPTARLESVMTAVGGTPVTVTLAQGYIEPVVACSVQYDANTLPVVPRVSAVTPTSFSLRLQNPSGAAVQTDNVYCLVVELGTWIMGNDNVKIEAQKYTSTRTDHDAGWVGEMQTYGQAYTAPVVLGQVMTENDTDFSVFWDRGAGRAQPPSASALWTGKTVAGDSDTTRSDEIVGFIVIESGHGTIGGVEFEAGLGPDSVFGTANGAPFGTPFDAVFTTGAPVAAVVTQAAMDGADGGWAQIHGPTVATTTMLYLSIDEDQIADLERGHVSEQVGYAAFASPVVYPAAPACAVNADCDDLAFCNGVETCTNGSCQAGTPVDCADGIGCTDDTCNEATDSCGSVTNDANCDDGLFCNGAETCTLGDCQDGVPVNCADSVGCTDDACDEVTDSCQNLPNDANCDDGAFCNGAETCDSVSDCQDGSEACPGETCDEVGDTCPTGAPSARMETLTRSVGPGTLTVGLAQGYTDPVVVCTLHYANNTSPVVTRVSAVTSNSFDVRLQSASGATPVTDEVSCLIVEQGMWTFNGHNVEAYKYTATVTDRKSSWAAEARTYQQPYTNPVVVGQVMSEFDPGYSAFWARGTSRYSPPSASRLFTGKMVGEDLVRPHIDEVVGYIVFESGSGSIGGVPFEAGVGSDTVLGVNQGAPFSYTFNAPFPVAPQVVVATLAGMDGGDGGWAQLFGAAPTTATKLYISADEDQIKDAERTHATEQVAYVAFGSSLVYP